MTVLEQRAMQFPQSMSVQAYLHNMPTTAIVDQLPGMTDLLEVENSREVGGRGYAPLAGPRPLL